MVILTFFLFNFHNNFTVKNLKPKNGTIEISFRIGIFQTMRVWTNVSVNANENRSYFNKSLLG